MIIKFTIVSVSQIDKEIYYLEEKNSFTPIEVLKRITLFSTAEEAYTYMKKNCPPCPNKNWQNEVKKIYLSL